MYSLSSVLHFAKKHLHVLYFIFKEILPFLIKTGRRPLLFSKYSGIGDIICTVPVALEIKRLNENKPIIYNCHSAFECLPLLGGVTPHTTDFQHIGTVAHRYGFLLQGFYQFASDDDKPDVIPKEVYIKDFGRQFGIYLSGEHPVLTPDPITTLRVKKILSTHSPSIGPTILLHAGPSWPVREWPQEKWNQLVDHLRSAGYTNIFQIGTTEHKITQGAGLCKIIHGAHSLVDRLSLDETISAISLADLFIGIDSGMLHIAASVNTPMVGLWGPTSSKYRFIPKENRRFFTGMVACQGCHHRVPRIHWIENCPHNIQCMAAISATEVASAAIESLTARSSSV